MKKFKLLDGNAVSVSPDRRGINWDLCVLCQNVKTECLQCPNNSTRNDRGAGYKSLEESIMQFNAIGELNATVRLNELDEGSGIAATLAAHNAQWHKSCRNLYNKTKLDRALKRNVTAKCNNSVEVNNNVVPEACSSGELEDVRHFTRSSNAGDCKMTVCCFICDESKGNLHAVTTFEVDSRVRSCAHALQDLTLIAKLSAGDLIALEAHYHAPCLVSLYKRAAAAAKKDVEFDDDLLVDKQSLAFAQLVAYIVDEQQNALTAPVFKLSDLAKKYQCPLKQMGVNVDSRVNTTKLKNRLLAHFPYMSAQAHGKEVLLMCSDDIGSAVSAACQFDKDMEAIQLVKAASILRRAMFKGSYKFSGNFTTDCQQNSVPQSLSAFVQMLLEGSNIDNDDMNYASAVSSISQLVIFNCVKHVRKPAQDIGSESVSYVRHNLSQETPLPLYISMMLHAETRKRDLIDKLFHLGLCVSYDRLQQVTANLANNITNHFDVTTGVYPLSLCKNVFTTAAVDNIDYNPGSATAVDSFHGTAISVVQHRTNREEGTMIGINNADFSICSRMVNPLPSSYTTVSPVGSVCKDVEVPDICYKPLVSDKDSFGKFQEQEYNWLSRVSAVVDENDQGKNADSTDCFWSTYHAQQSALLPLSDNSVMLPLFRDPSHSPAMICHALSVISSAVARVNPGQVPVVTFDQPLYALAKQIQWNWSNKFGEKQFVLILGGLHTEMAALKTVGDFLDGSGWTTALVNAGITSAGKADSMLHASHVTRTRYAHQVTASTLYILVHRAYDQHVHKQTLDLVPSPTFDEWSAKMCTLHPQFNYWFSVLQLELAVLMFVRSIRMSNFDMYIETLSNLVPWFFALNHHNYARWASVHLRDMCMLHELHPALHKEFTAGKFTVNKHQRPFSGIGLDLAHEQMNARVKGLGGAIGLTENPKALLRWMISGPEVSRVVCEFEQACGNASMYSNDSHHDQSESKQIAFSTHVSAMVSVMEEMGNPFADEGKELFAIDSHIICSSEVLVTSPMLPR